MNYGNLKTQKQIKQFTRSIIDKIGVCGNIKNQYPGEYDYITGFLFPRHPEYPEKFMNLKNIGIKKNTMFKQLEVYIINNNNSIEAVSVMNVCISGKSANDLSGAMRFAIYPQIKYFKENLKELKCANCNTDKNIEIDHTVIHFIDLQKNFIKDSGLKPPTCFKDTDWNGRVFRDEDSIFENEWKKYHKQNAKLQPLCKKCNLTKKKSKTIFINIGTSKPF